MVNIVGVALAVIQANKHVDNRQDVAAGQVAFLGRRFQLEPFVQFVAAHFRQVVGSQVVLRTPERKRLRGEVVSAGESAVTLRTQNEDLDIPYETIVRGNLIKG